MICHTCVFETERLLVKEWHSLNENEWPSQDLVDVVSSLLTARVTASLPSPWQGPYSRERSQDWIKERDQEGTTLLAVEKSLGSPVGLMVLFETESDSARSLVVRLGYLLAENAWGRGFATELVSGFVDWCRQTAITAVIGGVEENNVASIRVLQKCGFVDATTEKEAALDEKVFKLRLHSKEAQMTKREVIRTILEGKKPPYVPWSFHFTQEAGERLVGHFGTDDLEPILHNHFLELGSGVGFYEDLGNDRVRDIFGAVWDRSIDKDIGNVERPRLVEPTLAGYTFPDPLSPQFFSHIPGQIETYPDRFRIFSIGFSLYERAWILRGMENLMMDFLDHPDFVRELLRAIADYNIAHMEKALEYDIDAVNFGDDWGQQRGLQMGPDIWREFICPELRRMYSVVREAGKYVFIHCCGCVDELFDDLINIGLNCFNPFQPEVMDTASLLRKYRGRLAFHGGLSTQRTLPYGAPQDVRDETRRLMEEGKEGGYILAPAHAVEGDVPLDNMLVFIDEALNQPGFV